jgi:hypothetical protein
VSMVRGEGAELGWRQGCAGLDEPRDGQSCAGLEDASTGMLGHRWCSPAGRAWASSCNNKKQLGRVVWIGLGTKVLVAGITQASRRRRDVQHTFRGLYLGGDDSDHKNV